MRDIVLEALQPHLQLGDEVCQTSTIGAVMDGVYDGDITIGQLREHGDIGIGTFDDLDGEMVMVDGIAYRIDAECAAHPADDEARCEGTVVGFYTPEFLAHVGVPGLHIHFITQDRSAGGHVLALTLERGTLMADETLRLSLALPHTEAFRRAALAVDQGELKHAES